MTIFYVETTALALVIIASMVVAARNYKDSLHPMIYIGAMLLFLYIYLPLHLLDVGGLHRYLTDEHLELAQLINLVGCIALSLGVLWGSRRVNPTKNPAAWTKIPMLRQRMVLVAIAFGLAGVAGFLANIATVGGFSAAYGRAYGGGWSDSGYLRESMLWTLPALQWLIAPLPKRRWFSWLTIVVIIIAAPLAIQGVLGARRGPLFMALSGPIVGWYLARARRPKTWMILGGGALVGVLLLALVANRGAIYLGSDEKLDASPEKMLEATAGNEFIYGAATEVAASKTDHFFWGARYFVVFFIRPIPRSIWPDKYYDASRMLGIPDLEQNMGIGEDFGNALGWDAAVGAAPGIVADMWLEFSWLYVLALGAIGLLYGRFWRNAVTLGGVWTVQFGVITSLSLYLVMQTLEAMAFRFLLVSIPTAVLWWFAHRTKRAEQLRLRRTAIPAGRAV